MSYREPDPKSAASRGADDAIERLAAQGREERARTEGEKRAEEQRRGEAEWREIEGLAKRSLAPLGVLADRRNVAVTLANAVPGVAVMAWILAGATDAARRLGGAGFGIPLAAALATVGVVLALAAFARRDVERRWAREEAWRASLPYAVNAYPNFLARRCSMLHVWFRDPLPEALARDVLAAANPEGKVWVYEGGRSIAARLEGAAWDDRRAWFRRFAGEALAPLHARYGVTAVEWRND